MNITVEKPYTTPQNVTVQAWDGDVLAYCNHANHQPGRVTANAGLDNEYETLMEVCKCGATSEDGIEWYDAI